MFFWGCLIFDNSSKFYRYNNDVMDWHCICVLEEKHKDHFSKLILQVREREKKEKEEEKVEQEREGLRLREEEEERSADNDDHHPEDQSNNCDITEMAEE